MADSATTADDRLAQLTRTVDTLSRLHEAALDAITEAIHVAGREGADAALEYLGDWCNDCDAVDADAIASFDAYTVRRDASAAELVSLRGRLTAATEIHRPVKVAISGGFLSNGTSPGRPLPPTYVEVCAWCDNGVFTARTYPCPTAAALGGAR